MPRTDYPSIYSIAQVDIIPINGRGKETSRPLLPVLSPDMERCSPTYSRKNEGCCENCCKGVCDCENDCFLGCCCLWCLLDK
jgi:hypothetical protein